jgi:hypothetical protein
MNAKKLAKKIPLFPIIPLVPLTLFIGSFVLSILAFCTARQARAMA